MFQLPRYIWRYAAAHSAGFRAGGVGYRPGGICSDHFGRSPEDSCWFQYAPSQAGIVGNISYHEPFRAVLQLFLLLMHRLEAAKWHRVGKLLSNCFTLLQGRKLILCQEMILCHSHWIWTNPNKVLTIKKRIHTFYQMEKYLLKWRHLLTQLLEHAFCQLRVAHALVKGITVIIASGLC